jgi:hypothetical protein
LNKISHMNTVQEAVSHLRDITDASFSKAEGELDHFGKYVAGNLRQLPTFGSLRRQEQIIRIVTREETAILSQATQTYRAGSQTFVEAPSRTQYQYLHSPSYYSTSSLDTTSFSEHSPAALFAENPSDFIQITLYVADSITTMYFLSVSPQLPCWF